MACQPVDRTHNWELGIAAETIARWQAEGMPRDIHVGTVLWTGNEYFGIDRIAVLPLKLSALPEFDVPGSDQADRADAPMQESEPHLSASKPRHRQIHMYLAKSSSILPGSSGEEDDDPGFASPADLRGRFETLIRDRFRPDTRGRYPMWWPEVVRCLGEQESPLCVPGQSGIGLLSTLCKWVGRSGVDRLFRDEVRLAEEMLDFLADFVIGVSMRAMTDLPVDWFNWREDSPDLAAAQLPVPLFRKFLLPRYRRVNDFLRAHHVETIGMGILGNASQLVPTLLEAGFTCVWPVDCASGMNPLALRKEFGRTLRMMGGIDHRALTQGRETIRAELESKVPALVADGGYLPGLDTPVPPDVAYENWLYYLDVKRRLLSACDPDQTRSAK